jgi:phosphoglycolate phosphatase
MYKLVIFDFDGTLANSFSWFLQAINKAADKFHFTKLDLHQLEALRGYGPRQLITHMGLPFWKLPLVARYLRKLMAESRDEIKMFDGVSHTLEGLAARGLDSALLTSNSAENVRHILTEKNFSHFKYVECGTALYGKRARFRKILRASGLKPNETLYVGDEMRDAEAAKAEDIEFVGVSWGYAKPEELQKVSKRPLLQSLDDILQLTE